MTVHVLAEVAIDDLDQFISVFADEGMAKRAEHNCVGTTVFAPQEAGTVVVLMEFATAEGLDAFRSDPSAPPIMRKGGAQGPPTFRLLTRVASFPH